MLERHLAFVAAAKSMRFGTCVFGVASAAAVWLITGGAAGIVHASFATRDSAWLSRAPLLARWPFGLSSIGVGLAHVTGVRVVAAMVPKWMPFGGNFWAILTGIAMRRRERQYEVGPEMGLIWRHS